MDIRTIRTRGSWVGGITALTLAASLAGCKAEEVVPPPPGDLVQSTKVRSTQPAVSAAEREQFARDRNKFALDLYGAATTASPGNLFFSPHSISLALGMTWAGARTDTATEMASVLDFTQGDRTHAGFNDLDLQLTAAAGSDFELSIVNQLFGQRGEPFVPAFLDTIAENYGAGLRGLDFITQAEPSRVLINQWVQAATKDKIKDLIPEGTLDSSTRLVLANAIYFNAKWLTQFDKPATTARTFHTLGAGDASVPTMNGIIGLPYAAGPGYQAVELPYKGGRAALLLLVPDAGTIAAFEKTLDADVVAGIAAQLAQKQVELALPKFTFEARLPLKALLGRMGMKKAFDPNAADFSGMDPNKLFLTDVLHKAFVRVDEEGTEAAAATAAVAGTTSVPLIDVKLAVDRPFLLAVRDRTTGVLLFLGRVVDPR